MTPKQVRAIMFEKPESITRIATSRGIHEIWIYGSHKDARMAIHFERLRSKPRSTSKVVNVTREPAAKNARR